jgi:hypothetical protein
MSGEYSPKAQTSTQPPDTPLVPFERLGDGGSKRRVMVAAVLLVTAVLFWLASDRDPNEPSDSHRGNTITTVVKTSGKAPPGGKNVVVITDHPRQSESPASIPSEDVPSAAPISPSPSVLTTSDERTAISVLPHASTGVAVSSVFSYATTWTEKGDQGWRKTSRRAGESCASCRSLVTHLEAEYDDAKKRYNNFQASAAYKMPWYYHDPFPVCGQLLLMHLQGGPRHVFSLRLPPNRLRKPPPSAAALEFKDLPLIKESAAKATGKDNLIGGGIDDDTETLFAKVGETVLDVFVEDCGSCGSAAGISTQTPDDEAECRKHADVLLTARLVGINGFIPATVRPIREAIVEQQLRGGGAAPPEPHFAGRGGALRVAFTVSMPGVYSLEVKAVHVHGESTDPKLPRSLGVIGIRAVESGNRKSFKYNGLCDEQRHIYGSPVRVVALETGLPVALTDLPSTVKLPTTVPPFCDRANHTSGRWVRFTPTSCHDRQNPYCFGNPAWLSDAAAYNTNYLWAPDGCRYAFFDPPTAPAGSCLTVPNQGPVFLLLVGDSVTREYTKNCLQFSNLRKAKLHCLFANIALEGQHYSVDYATSVARVVIENVKTNNAGVFVTNLGIHHMIGPCTTEQWAAFVAIFAELWKKEILWHPQAHRGTRYLTTEAGKRVSEGGALPALYPKGTTVAKLERAIWLGPPTIHYARKGMGAQRAALWDQIAWAKLEPLGFERVYAIAPTAARQESTWDGLHYASERNKVQTRWRNTDISPRQWNGGVANMLFTMLLNLICYGGPR